MGLPRDPQTLFSFIEPQCCDMFCSCALQCSVEAQIYPGKIRVNRKPQGRHGVPGGSGQSVTLWPLYDALVAKAGANAGCRAPFLLDCFLPENLGRVFLLFLYI